MNSETVKSIAWREVFPWLILLRTLPLSASLSVWTLATIAVVLAPIGWLVAELIFVGSAARSDDPQFQDAEFREFVRERRSPYRGIFSASRDSASFVEVWERRLSGPQLAFERHVEPIRRLFDRDMNFRKFAYLVTGAFWTIAIWSLCGCGISRICLLRLARDETAGLDDAFEFTSQKLTTVIAAAGLPLLGAALACIPCAAIGLIMTIDLGAVIGGLLWFVVLGFAGLATVILALYLFGWPLTICAISAENQNSLDALTRSFAYVLQRPMHYALYAIVSILLGGLCWILVAQLAVGTIQTAHWAASWGTNLAAGDRMDQLSAPSTPAGSSPTEMAPPAAAGELASATAATNSPPSNSLELSKMLIRFWNGLVSTLAVAFLFGQFWCLAAGVYLLLRRDVDETEMDEVFHVDETRAYELPPLKSDHQGIPVIRPLDGEIEGREPGGGDRPPAAVE